MLIPWWPVLLYPLPLMVIPLAIALGQIVRGGPVTVMSIGAGLGLGAFWLALRDFYLTYYIANVVLWLVLSALAGATLLLGAWALALAQTFRARQWVWLALLCLAFYGSIATLVFFEWSGYAACLLDQAAFCGQMNTNTLPLFVAASFLAPVVLLVFALWAGVRRQPRTLPEGLTVSRLPVEEH